MLFNGRYGYFVDELYYLACSHHLDWGYVDQAPLIAAATWLERVTLGDSLHALRFLPALAAGLKVLLTGLIARELGARAYAQVLACVAVIAAPLYLGFDNLLTMNAFEPLFWMGSALIAVKIIKGGDQRLWLLFGVLAGIGLENKHSMLFFGFGFFVGLLLTPERRLLRQPWIWLGGLLAFLIFLPNLVWETHRSFPTTELLRNVQRSGRNVALGPVGFILQQVLLMHPLAAPLWLADSGITLATLRDGISVFLVDVSDHPAVLLGAERACLLSGAGVSDAVCGGCSGVPAICGTAVAAVA